MTAETEGQGAGVALEGVVNIVVTRDGGPEPIAEAKGVCAIKRAAEAGES